nr:reverse transcriptase domain-containing protein [Tanacetum cinerariifolium]
KGCVTWDGGNSTWGGRAKGIGTVPLCVSVQEMAGGEGRVLAGMVVKGALFRADLSSSPNSLAIITGNLLSPSKNAYSRWGGSGTLSSNSITNPKEDLKRITTRSGNAYKGPTIPTTTSPPKVLERDTEVTKDTVPPTNNGSTKDVHPSVVQVETPIPNSELVVAPVRALVVAPVGVTKDVFVKVGSFHFPADFVVVDFDADPRVSLILGRSFLKTERALIDVYEGELTLHVGKEAVTFNLDHTSRYSDNYDAMSVNRNDLIDVACEEYSQE